MLNQTCQDKRRWLPGWLLRSCSKKAKSISMKTMWQDCHAAVKGRGRLLKLATTGHGS